jgi:hypothetical protein
LFGRHVGQRADDAARSAQRLARREIGRLVAAHELGQPEVEHLDSTIRRDHHVRAFQVAMDDSAIVRMCKGLGQLHAVTDHVVDRQRPAGDPSAERRAVDDFHRDVGVAVGFADVVDGADVRMIERGRGARLAQQALPPFRIRRQITRQNLESDVARQTGVVRAIDLAMPPAPSRD